MKLKDLFLEYDPDNNVWVVVKFGSLSKPLGKFDTYPEAKKFALECTSNKPQENKVYALTGGPGSKCIANGNSWAESEVKENK
jgi:hypothetical protein